MKKAIRENNPEASRKRGGKKLNHGPTPEHRLQGSGLLDRPRSWFRLPKWEEVEA